MHMVLNAADSGAMARNGSRFADTVRTLMLSAGWALARSRIQDYDI